MKIFAIVDYESNWYPKNAIELFKKHANLNFVSRPEDADLIWIFSYYCPLNSVTIFRGLFEKLGLFNGYRKTSIRDKLIITSFHHLDKEKESQYLPYLKKLDRLSDYIHFFSEINVNENKHYFKKEIITLPYWVDTEKFKPLPGSQKQAIRRTLDIPINSIVLGSFQRDTEADGLTPKLSKGPDLFCDIIEGLDKNNKFVLLAGPRRQYIEKRLHMAGVKYLSLGYTPYTEMNNLYNCLDYYLVTSRCEGGPQAILECMANGTKIYSTPVGISNLMDSRTVFTKSAEFIHQIDLGYPDVILKHRQAAQRHKCSEVVPMYVSKFDELIKNKCQ